MALGVGIGMLFYKLTISRWLVKAISKVINIIKEFVWKILFYILKPFLKLGCGIRRSFRYIKARIKTVGTLFKKKLTLSIKMLKITLRKR